LLFHYECAQHNVHVFYNYHAYPRVFHDFHVCGCVYVHLFLHDYDYDYENDYVFFINDLINAPNLFDHDDHLISLRNQFFVSMYYLFYLHGHDYVNDFSCLWNRGYDHFHVHDHVHVNDHVNVPQDDNAHHLNEE